MVIGKLARYVASIVKNIGAIGITRVAVRRVVEIGMVRMIGLGIVRKFGALFTTLPQPRVGGLYCAMFSMIARAGLSNLQSVDLSATRNPFILGVAFFMELSPLGYSNTMLFTSAFLTGWGDYYAQGSGPVRCVGVLISDNSDLVNTVDKTGRHSGVAGSRRLFAEKVRNRWRALRTRWSSASNVMCSS